jgi:hypothetical protein
MTSLSHVQARTQAHMHGGMHARTRAHARARAHTHHDVGVFVELLQIPFVFMEVLFVVLFQLLPGFVPQFPAL